MIKNKNEIKSLIENTNFRNNQNYLINKSLKNRIIRNYNLYERDGGIDKLRGYRLLEYKSQKYYMGESKKKSSFSKIFAWSILSLPIISILFLFFIGLISKDFIFGTLYIVMPGILAYLFLSITEINKYEFYRVRNTIYYKLK